MPMSEMEKALQLERALESRRPTDGESWQIGAPSEEAALGDLASHLSTMDLSGEVADPAALRARSLEAPASVVGSMQGRGTFPWRHRKGLVAAVLLLGVSATLVGPLGLLKAAQEYYRRLSLGDRSVQIEYRPGPDPAFMPSPKITCMGDRFQIATSLGPYNGSVPKGAPPCVEQYRTIEEARERLERSHYPLPLDLKEPTFVPDGYALDQVMVGPDDVAFIFYQGPGPEIEIMERTVGTYETDEGTINSTLGLGPNRPIEKLTVNGYPGAWLEGHTVGWVADGVAYGVGGRGMRMEDLLEVAESLE